MMKKRLSVKQTKIVWGYIFIMPAILGILCFYLGPMVFSLVMSLFHWDIITPPIFAGASNYKNLITDPLVLKSLRVTLYYTLLTVPASSVCALLTAVLLNAKGIKGLSIFRTIFYIPSIVPAIASAILWTFLFNPMFGIFNTILLSLGMDTQTFIADPNLVIPCMAFMAVWSCGSTTIIYLAGLQGIPSHLYESIDVDGGNIFHKFFYITLPMLSPIIFYNVLMCIITSLQTFTQGYLMTDGGPANASLFYVLNLYRTAFKNSQMGFASAQSWLLFIVVMIFTLISFRISKKTVYYEGGV